MVSFRIIKFGVFWLPITILLAHNFINAHLQYEIDEPNWRTLDSKPIYNIIVEGNNFFRAKEIKFRLLDRLERSGISAKSLEHIAYQLKIIYRKAGFEKAEIKISASAKNTIRVKIKEGKQLLIDNVKVDGGSFFIGEILENKVFQFIKNKIEHYELSVALDKAEIDEIFSGVSRQSNNSSARIYNGGYNFSTSFLPYDVGLFAEVKNFLHNLYFEYGFLDVKILGPNIIYSKWGYFAQISYRVIEGRQFLIGNVKLVENSNVAALLTTDVKESPVFLKKGEPVNGEKIEKQRVAIEEFLLNNGYPFASVKVSTDFNEDKLNADLTYAVSPGTRVKIGEIIIIGNERTNENTILHRFKLKPDDWFSLDKITASRTNLYQMDLFDEVNINLDARDFVNESRRTLHVTVKERRLTTIDTGLGLSLEDGPRFRCNFYRRNIFGLGIGLSSRLKLNYPVLFYNMPFFYSPTLALALNERYNTVNVWLRPLMFIEGQAIVGLVYPSMLHFPFDTDGSIDLSLTREIKPAYDANKITFQTGLSAQLISWIHSALQVEIEYTNFDCPYNQNGQGCGNRSYNFSQRLDAGIVNQITLKMLLLIDKRKTLINAKSGFAFELSGDLSKGSAELSSEFQSSLRLNESRSIGYLKLTAGFKTFMPIGPYVTWIMNAKVGKITDFTNDGYVPLFKRFYLGGTNTVRGFAEDQILPADNIAINNPGVLSLGANFFFLARNEIRFPLFKDLDGGLFLDAGELLENPRNFNFSALSSSCGFGIRYDTPIGPLLFDLAFRLFAGNQNLPVNILERIGFHFAIGY